jgi:hypothetical protein
MDAFVANASMFINVAFFNDSKICELSASEINMRSTMATHYGATGCKQFVAITATGLGHSSTQRIQCEDAQIAARTSALPSNPTSSTRVKFINFSYHRKSSKRLAGKINFRAHNCRWNVGFYSNIKGAGQS